MKIYIYWIFFLLFSCQMAAAEDRKYFNVLPLGVSGGELENNLSAYLVAPAGTQDFVALDAGTLCSAIKKIPAAEYNKIGIHASAGNSLGETLLSRYIKSYLISHAHLDHISGMIMCSTIDSHKDILGRDSTIDYLRDYIFNWKIWPNLADEGNPPLIKQYHYRRLNFDIQYSVPGTAMTVRAFPLSHGFHYPSTAFLLEFRGHYLLYFGDTGSDPIEGSEDIHKIWQMIAPLIRAHKLESIFIEASYPDDRPDKLLFGHLTPRWVLFELNQLSHIVNPQHPVMALQGLQIVVTHIKVGLEDRDIPGLIATQLNEKNNLGVKFIIPKPLQLMIF